MATKARHTEQLSVAAAMDAAWSIVDCQVKSSYLA